MKKFSPNPIILSKIKGPMEKHTNLFQRSQPKSRIRKHLNPKKLQIIREAVRDQTSMLDLCQPRTGVPKKASIHLPSSIYWEYKAKVENPEKWKQIELKRGQNLKNYVEKQ